MDNELALLMSQGSFLSWGRRGLFSELFLCPCTAKVFVTPGKPWADTIDCSYRKEHTAKDLVGLKSYLASGTIVSVMEEKVSMRQSWMKGERAAGRPGSSIVFPLGGSPGWR